jgi:GAF domain-containing protein/HAMP domain-containing protein
MKIYSKILFITLPLIVIPAVIVSLVTYQITRTALRTMANETLSGHLSKAINICIQQINTIRIEGKTGPEAVAGAQSAAAEALKTANFGKTGYTVAIDASGFVLSHHTQKYIRQNISGESWFNDILNKDQGSFTFTWEGEKRLAYFQRFPDWNWFIISTEAESELLEPVDRLGVTIAALLAVSLLVAFIAVLVLARWLTTPIQALLAGTERIRKGELAVPIEIKSKDEIGTLAVAFNSMTDQLRAVIGSLENRVSERTVDLERRALHLQTSSEIAQEAVSTHDLSTLLDRSVNLIQERFSFYHVSIYSLDEQRQFAVLKAGAGEVGKIMVQRGLRVRIGEIGIVSQVAGSGEPRVINDVSVDFSYVKHPLLPDTACAAAFPLKVGGQTIGVLEVENQRTNVFTQDIITVLQTLANQLAGAIENTRLLEDLRNSLQESHTLYQRYTQESWSRTAKTQKISGFQFDLSQVTTYTRNLPDDLRTRLLEGHAIPIQDQPGTRMLDDSGDSSNEHRYSKNRSVLIAPLILHDQLIGVLGVEDEDPEHTWSPVDITLLEAISNQVSLTLDNARLVEETQSRASRDRMVAEITNKMRRAVDMDTLIQTAVREITQAINVPEAFIQLGVHPSTQGTGQPQPLTNKEPSDPNLAPEWVGTAAGETPSEQV